MRRLRWYHPRVASFLRVFGSIGRIRRGTLVASLSWTRRRRAGYAARGPTAPHAGLSTPEAGASFRRADAHPTRSFIRLLGSEDMAGASGDGKSRAGSPRAAFFEPRMRPFLILRSELTPSAPCGRAQSPLAANPHSQGLMKKRAVRPRVEKCLRSLFVVSLKIGTQNLHFWWRNNENRVETVIRPLLRRASRLHPEKLLQAVLECRESLP